MKQTKLNFKKSFTVLVVFLGMLTTTPSWAYNGLLTGEGSTTSPYYIMDLDDWATFTSWLNNPETAPYYCDKHYRLGADINVTTWAATNPAYPFRGTFDGNGHTIHINFEQTEDQGVALFQHVGNGCEIHDLTVDGTINTDYKFAAGIISIIQAGEYDSPTFVSINRCRVLVTFNLGISGDATSGGLVAFSQDHVRLTINNCLFGGSFTTSTASHLSGFVGYQASNGYTYIENCYVDPLSLNIPKDGNNRNLCRYINNDSFKEANCYYSAKASNFTNDQGEYITPSHNPEWIANQLGYWTVSSDKPVPTTLNMVAENCTLFKGFTVSGYSIRFNTNDNNGDQGAAKIVDGDRSTSWRVSYPYNTHSNWEPVCVEFYCDKKFIPKGYILTTGNDSREHPDRRPKKWQVCGYQNTYSPDSDILDTRDASSSKDKLPETEITDKVYFFPDYENINTGYQKFSFMVTELWREDRGWDEFLQCGWNVNGADFVCELGEIQIFGVLSDEVVHNMENCAISGIQSCYDYTGDVIPLNYLVTDYNNTLLVEDADYTKTIVRKHGSQILNNVTEIKEPGEYTITIDGMNDYSGSKSYSFVVTDPGIPMPMVLTNDNGMTYYYVKMPKTGQTTLDLTSTDPDFTQQFYVFSDNGHNLPYSSNCDGKLLITAPEGYVLQVQGDIQSQGYPNDYFVIYDSDDTNTILGEEHYGTNGTKSIPLLYTTGRNLLLYFKSDDINNSLNGLNLSVAPVLATSKYDINLYNDGNGELTTTDIITDIQINTPVTLNINPYTTDYMLQDVSVKTANNTPVHADKGLWYTGYNTVEFNMPASDVEVTPTFAMINDLYVNMPANSSDLGYATNAIIPAGVTNFKVYDDGGPNSNYSQYCNGMLLLTAPENTVFEISGTMDVYDYDDSYLGIYNGDDFSNPIECYYGDANINRVLSTDNKVLLVFVTYETQAAGLDLTVRVINRYDEAFRVNINNVTGGTVAVQGGATHNVFDNVTLDVTPTSGCMITHYDMWPDCNTPILGGVWHENPTEATFVMPANDIEITPMITNTLTADGGLYIDMPTSNKYDYKVVDIPSGVTSFKVYDDGGSTGDYSMYCDGYLVLKAPSGYHLKLSGTVRCNDSGAIHDYLKVYDGDTVTAMPLGKLNGYGNTFGETINSLVSSQNSMLLNFHSANNSMSGLDLTVEVTNETYSYTITFDDSQAPEGCSISISGYESVSNNQYVANVSSTITVNVTNDDNHLLNAISLKDADGNEIPLSAGMCWYNGNNNTATFTMLPRNLFITYEFVNKGDQYVKLPKQNGAEAVFEVAPIEGITSFKIYDDGGPNGNYSNNCDSYMLLKAPEGEAWQLTGTVKTEKGNDYLIPYDGNTTITMIDGCSYGKSSGEDIGALVTINNKMLIVFGSNNAVNDEGLDLTATIVNPITLTIEGYANVPPGQDRWTFIAAPLKHGKTPTYVEGIFPLGEYGEPLVTSTEYDLYRFNQSADAEWENYKIHSGDFSIDGGNGYLYATMYARTMCFGGSVCTEDSKEVPLVYDATAKLPGCNLVGNPLRDSAYVDRPYYRMDEMGSEVEMVKDYARTPIPKCTGVVVCAEKENEVVTFSKTKPSTPAGKGSVNITLSKAGVRNSSHLDNAIISFNEGSQLGKFYFGEQDANIYIPQDGKEYAIVSVGRDGVYTVSTGVNEIPVNFKARKNGEYILTVTSPLTSHLSSLTLIDNLTGANIDLLQTPSYTFTAKNDDYASRFKLVFNALDNENDNQDFAFISNGEITINGTGTIQVIDVLGHIIVSRDGVHTVSTKGMTAGVYVLRLVNGQNVKTQKIIIN